MSNQSKIMKRDDEMTGLDKFVSVRKIKNDWMLQPIPQSLGFPLKKTRPSKSQLLLYNKEQFDIF